MTHNPFVDLETLIPALNAPQARLCGVPEGLEAFVLQACEALRGRSPSAGKAPGRGALVVVQSGERLEEIVPQLEILLPSHQILAFPAWDCMPYDRAAPHKDLVGRRLTVLKSLLALEKTATPYLVVTSAKALLQKLPPRDQITSHSLTLEKGASLSLEALQAFLIDRGYLRVETVREPGEYAVRGGLVDLYSAGAPDPVRIDFFGDEIDHLMTFDPLSQRSEGPITQPIDLMPAGEVTLDAHAIRHFRENYRALFGHASEKDPLYGAISEGRAYPGMEHWLPLFYPQLSSLWDYLGAETPIYFCHQSERAFQEHWVQIEDHYAARQQSLVIEGEKAYHPVPPEHFFLRFEEITGWAKRTLFLTPFSEPETLAKGAKSEGGAEDSVYTPGGEVFIADLQATALLGDLKKERPSSTPVEKLKQFGVAAPLSKPTLILCEGEGAQTKTKNLLDAVGLTSQTFSITEILLERAAPLKGGTQKKDFLARMGSSVGLGLFPLTEGFETPRVRVLSARGLYGKRPAGRPRRQRRSDLFIEESSALAIGDLVVHENHGVGRYNGLHTLTIDKIPHDCLQLLYAGDDKLFLPVENLDLITRFGGEASGVALDKLGGKAWQLRRQKVKQDLMAMASQLIDLAAQRQLQTATPLAPDPAFYQDFVGRFPYEETQDQQQAIEECLGDLRSGFPMDRLVCGDVGFGKTEVAMRVAAAVVSSGKQVALIAPTTLLARQHFLSFKERFEDLGVTVRQLSRFVTPKKAAQTKKDLKEGRVDILIGTHALLSKQVGFLDLGLIIVDEEQHFGVKQKERLKSLKTDVHVLTLSATPIPRTLQLSLSGVREMSLITTPPVDRLAVRTFITPFDPVVIKDAVERERFRGGQTFFVCPRIKDIEACRETLLKLIPTLKIAIATGQMSARELEDVMVAFSEKEYDLLLSTNIIESGIDLPQVNTLIVHRSDLFGLSQLYQLKGRVGRGKVRGYAYFTTPVGQVISDLSQKRLEIMQTLDTLGAGFKLASHDMDLRGAGNLLGDAQSGHVKEVGVELYQQMLEDAVATVKSQGEASSQDGGTAGAEVPTEKWTPQLNLGLAVLIPESYVADLSVRLTLYRRLSWSQEEAELEDITAEMIDRFGPLPQEVQNLLVTVKLKQLCRRAGVSKLDIGAKGIVISFHRQTFAAPDALISYVLARPGVARLRPDQSLVYLQAWPTLEFRLQGAQNLLKNLVKMCEGAPPC